MLKKLVLASLVAVAFSAQAQTFNSTGYVSFNQSIPKESSGSKTYIFSFTGLAAGVYDVVGSFSGYNFNATSASFNGTALDTQKIGKFSFGSINYTGASPFTFSITGTRMGKESSGFSGSLAAVSAVPEPESIAMMLAGLGVIGAVVSRRNRAGSLTAPVAA